MAVPAVVEDITKIPEKDREHYVENTTDKKWYLQGDGIKTVEDVNRVQEALRKERTDHGKVKEELKKYATLGNPEEVLTKLDRFTELEEIANNKIDPAKLDALAETKAKTKMAPLERQVATLTTELGQTKTQLGDYQSKEKIRTIHDAVRSVASASGILPTAIEDALMIAERVFDVNEQGQVVTKENVGVTPYVEPKVWLTEVQEKRPHWWPGSNGGGARNGNNNAGVKNPFSDEHWNLTEQGKLVKENPGRADQMAASAGTTVGGPRPTKKK